MTSDVLDIASYWFRIIVLLLLMLVQICIILIEISCN